MGLPGMSKKSESYFPLIERGAVTAVLATKLCGTIGDQLQVIFSNPNLDGLPFFLAKDPCLSPAQFRRGYCGACNRSLHTGTPGTRVGCRYSGELARC